MAAPYCDNCHGLEFVPLGALGTLHYYRCRGCGWQICFRAPLHADEGEDDEE